MFDRAEYSFIVKYGSLTPDGVAVYDLNTRKFVYLNRFFEHMFALPADELLADPALILDRVGPEDIDFLENRYRELLSIGCIGPTEFRVRPRTGTVSFLSAEVLWLEESYTFAIFVKDVTRSRIHEDYTLDFGARKDTLLDMLIHNLSGPLYLSRGLLKHTAGAGQIPERLSRSFQLTLENTEHCLDIVNDFLKQEHTESTKTIVRKTRFSLADKIALSLEIMRQMNPEIEFIISMPEKPPVIHSDVVKFCQIVHNIVSNSVKFTADNGRIEIAVREIEDHYEITFTDNGVGIPASILSRIFKEKVIGRAGLKGEKSAGIGLFIVKRLVEMLGGEISLSSREHEGTRVRVLLPLE